MPALSDREIRERQAGTRPNEDLSPYEGKWVAVRDGQIVAHASSLGKLLNQPGVSTNDAVFAVPPAGATALL